MTDKNKKKEGIMSLLVLPYVERTDESERMEIWCTSGEKK